VLGLPFDRFGVRNNRGQDNETSDGSTAAGDSDLGIAGGNAGTLLRKYGCDDYNGKSWCEMSTLNYRSRGWARDRYLRPAYGSSHYPDYGNTGGDMIQV